MLAVVVVLFLAVGVSDAMILTKCELKQQLQTGLTLKVTKPADVLAQIVCYVQQSSGFNTSAIKTITEQEEHQGRRLARTVKAAKKSSNDEVTTLYGLFQFSDHMVCYSNSTQNHSLNLCKLSCNKLIDDNISDDIACVQTIVNAVIARAPGIYEKISQNQKAECKTITAKTYFAGC